MKNTRRDYVDTSIGTVGDEQDVSLHGGGKTHPGACFPGGMVQLSPDTVTGGDNGSGYHYGHDTIEGFSMNHMSGSGWYGDLGNLQMMPVVGETDLRSGSNEEVPFRRGTRGWRSGFSHETEVTKAGYYAVFLQRYGIQAEATVAEHTGFLRITYPRTDGAGLLFNFSRRIAGKADFEEITVTDATHVEGRIVCTPQGGGFGRGDGGVSYTLCFSLALSQPIRQFSFFSQEAFVHGTATSCQGGDVGLLVRFDAGLTVPVTVTCGLSYVDIDGARRNRLCETADFDVARERTADAWERALSCVAVEGKDETDLTLFYTCLYHVLLDPRTHTDVDGRCRLRDGDVFTPAYRHRTMFSGWDVYRSEFPLLTVIRPDIVSDTVNSLVTIAVQERASLPRWELMGNDSRCMVGDPGLLVTADAYIKGIRDFDVSRAYAVAEASAGGWERWEGAAFRPLCSRREACEEQAFIPGKLSETLEFLLADFALSQWAQALGREEEAAYWRGRAARYPDNYNPATGFMGARDRTGAFLPVRDRYDTVGCVESNVFQQSWFVPYDVEGLRELMGKERAVTLLETLFSQAEFSRLWNEAYNHSNEPCHNLTHYFSVWGLPERTQYWTRRVQKEAYRTGPYGYCGNEDVGQLSAWYVLSAVGLAQLCIGDGRFWLNTPLFQSVRVTLDPRYHTCTRSHQFTITCDRDPLAYPYIQEMYLNEERLMRHYITFEEITAGGHLSLVLKRE